MSGDFKRIYSVKLGRFRAKMRYPGENPIKRGSLWSEGFIEVYGGCEKGRCHMAKSVVKKAFVNTFPVGNERGFKQGQHL